MNVPSNRSGYLLIEGACFDEAQPWFAKHYPTHRAIALLINTPYAAIANAGPFMVQATLGSPLHIDWWQDDPMLSRGIWLDTPLAPEKLFTALQRRLKVRSSQGQEYWLRLGDAAALTRVWQVKFPWPEGFWHGIDSVWTQHKNEPLCLWQNPSPDQDAAPDNTGLQAQIILPNALFRALSDPKENTDD